MAICSRYARTNPFTVVFRSAATTRTRSSTSLSIASVMFFVIWLSPQLHILCATVSGRSSLRRVLHRLHDLLRRVVEIVGRQHVQPGVADDLLAGIDIGALQPHHQRDLQ